MRFNSCKKRFIYILILNFTLSSCSFAQKKNDNEESLVSAYSNIKVFFKIFEASLAKDRNIKLLLKRNSNSNNDDNFITCSIIDDGEKKSEIFFGEINEKGEFNIKSNENEELIILKGKFLSDSTIIIDYLDSKRQRFIKIKMNQTITSFSIFPIHYENSKTVNNDTCDSITNTVQVDMLSLKLSDMDLSNKINHTIEESVYEDQTYKNIDDYIEKVELTYDSNIDNLNLLEINNDVFIFKNLNGYRVCGSAHGEYNNSYLNLNLQSGKKINLEDILLSNSLKKLIGILQVKLKSEKNEFVLGKNEKLNLENNFALLKKGIMFSYGQYDLESIPEGVEILIPYSEIYGILNTDSEIYKKIVKK